MTELKIWACLMLLIMSVSPAFSQMSGESDRSAAPSTPRRENAAFRIGFLSNDAEQTLSTEFFNRLKKDLWDEPQIHDALITLGFGSIAALPADGHRDLVTRMEHGEFDLVFCPSLVYGTQEGPYRVMLQLRRDRDIWDTHGEGKVLQQGVVFVSNRSPLFTADQPTTSQIAAYIGENRMAVVSAFSAAGYCYPFLKLARDYGGARPNEYFFCDSSEEVVKTVVSGLADLGACERGVIERVLDPAKTGRESSEFVKILFFTNFSPTDPVVIRDIYRPEVSELGRRIKDGLKQFMARPDIATLTGGIRLEASSDAAYKNLREELKNFRKLQETWGRL